MADNLTHILLVEDSAADRELLREYLSAAAISVDLTVAGSLKEATAAVKAGAFDLVLLDLNLPDSLGIDTVKAAVGMFSDLPIIVLTGWFGEETGNNAVHTGTQDYLVKGHFTPEVLRRSIRYALERHSFHQALRQARDHLEVRVAELEQTTRSLREEIAERKRTEAALRNSEERFRTLVESITDYTYRVKVKGGQVIETLHGPGCLGVTGYAPEELHANPDLWIQMVHQEDRSLVLTRAAKLSSGQKAELLEHRIIHKNGEIRWVRNTAVLRYDNRGNCIGYEGLIQDITEYKRLQDQFTQAQKMEAVGLLAGGVAHDFRNQLTVIKGYAEMLLRGDLVKGGTEDYVKNILKAANRSATVSGQLLAFSRQQALRPQIVNIDSVTGDMMKSLAQTLGEDIQLSVIPCGDLWNIRVDVGLFQQALLNLVLNARDAMPQGGQLTVQARNVLLDESAVRQHTDVSPGRHVVLTVRDTGVGMTRQTLAHLFEPFFTTKPVGEGTGLGLAMVYGFVHQSGGFVEVDSHPGQDTEFRLFFPAVEDIAESAEQSSHTANLPRGTGTILVVEDEDAIRRLLLATLSECGYAVLTAANAQEALALIQSTKEKIDLLITDVVMPGMSGPDLARHFAQARPGVPVLLLSGYTGKMLTEHGVVPSDVNLLSKPFSTQMLAETLGRIIGQPQ